MENLRIMKKRTGTHARAHPNTQVNPDIFMAMHIAPFMFNLCKYLSASVQRRPHMNMGIAVLLL